MTDDAPADAPEEQAGPDEQPGSEALTVPDEAPTAGETDAEPPADPASLELQDELDSIRATGEDLRG